MANIPYYMNYVVFFSDPTDYATATGLTGQNYAIITPSDIATMFAFVDGVNYNTSQPLYNQGDTPKGMYQVGNGATPYYTAGFPTTPPGVEIFFPLASGVFVTWDTNNIIVPGQAGTPASIWPAGPDAEFIWVANFVMLDPSFVPSDTVLTAPIPKRRFALGFELQSNTIGGVSGTYTQNRSSSRTVEGCGFGIRSNSSQTIGISQSLYVTPQDTRKTWERFYLRVPTSGGLNGAGGVGSEEVIFWRVLASPQPLNGCYLTLDGSGGTTYTLRLYNRATGVGTVVASTTIATSDEFRKFDILLNFGSGGATTGSIRVYIDGTIAFSVTGLTNGVGSNSTHSSSELGITGGTSSNGWEYDLDDWHSAEIPNIGGVEALTSVDWLNGTHIQLQKSTTITPNSWAGPTECVNQMIGTSNAATTSQLTSSTSSDTLEVETDADDTPEGINAPLGLYVCVAALRAVVFTERASGTANAQLGYMLAGGAAVLETVSISATDAWDDSFYPGTGTDILPATIVPASAVFVHPADTTEVRVRACGLEVQYVGLFSQVDGDGYPSPPTIFYQHNAPWPAIAQAFHGPTTNSFFAVEGGTYTGNDTEQSIPVAAPFHFLYIRPVGSANPGAVWFAGQLAPSVGIQGASRPDMVARVDFDITTGITTFTVTGTSINNNSNGVEYQYIAICDPAFRYLINGSYQHQTGAAGPYYNPLLISGLTYDPTVGFVAQTRFTADVTARTMFKGVGNAGTTGQIISGTAITAMGEWASGVWQSGADAQDNGAINEAAYCFMRPADGCDNTMFSFGTYTGDASNPRTISFAPSTGRYPLFVFVQPHNAAAICWDPSDVAPSSRNFTAGTAGNNGITAVGVSEITVDSTLNANGIVYEVLVIWGDNLGGNNGIFMPAFCDTTNLNGEPEEPPADDINIITDGGLVLNGIAPLTLLLDASGIYTLVPDLHHDELLNRLPDQEDVEVKIPDPTFKTGYIGG